MLLLQLSPSVHPGLMRERGEQDPLQVLGPVDDLGKVSLSVRIDHDNGGRGEGAIGNRAFDAVKGRLHLLSCKKCSLSLCHFHPDPRENGSQLLAHGRGEHRCEAEFSDRLCWSTREGCLFVRSGYLDMARRLA